MSKRAALKDTVRAQDRRGPSRATADRAVLQGGRLSALNTLAATSPAVRALQRIAAAQQEAQPSGVPDPLQRQVVQLQEAWRGALQGDDADIWRSVDQFLGNYKIVEEGELDPEIGFPSDYREANEEEEHDTAPLLKPLPDSTVAIKIIAKQVAADCVARFKTPDGRKEILATVGTGGIAGYIEGEILDQIRPFLKKTVKSLMPWSSERKTRETLMGLTEGIVDVVYNACAFGVEAMSAAAATPAVATGGAAYKASFAASNVRRAGGTTEQASATAAITSAAEFGQGMIPFAGGGFGIASGLKGVADKTRIKQRIENMLKGAGGGSSAMAARKETIGDMRIFRVLEARSDHLADLIARAERCADAHLKGNSEKRKQLAKAQIWLNDQVQKARKRFAKSDKKGNVPLLSRAYGAEESEGVNDFG